MKNQKLNTILLALGLSASLFFQAPVFATEDSDFTDTSSEDNSAYDDTGSDSDDSSDDSSYDSDGTIEYLSDSDDSTDEDTSGSGDTDSYDTGDTGTADTDNTDSTADSGDATADTDGDAAADTASTDTTQTEAVSTEASQTEAASTEAAATDTQEQAEVSQETDTQAATDSTATSQGITTNSISGWPQGPEITAESAVIMEASTGTVLYGKNTNITQLPAGTVKIMTCLLALENSQLTDTVTMTETGVSGVTDGGASLSSQLGETFTMEQCLYAMMVGSANDVALQVAEQISGSVDAFVAAMNERASQLGCTDTVFTNPTGLPDDNQHTTAHDLALIMQAAIQNDSFRTIVSATSYTIPATNISAGVRNLTSTFTMNNSGAATFYEGCIGGKESTATASGSTLACSAERNGVTLIAVLLKGTAGQTDSEAASLLDYGFNNFQLLDIGNDDFNILSGGTVMVPAGATAADLTTQDTEDNDQISRQYFFGGAQVGTAVVEDVKDESGSDTQINDTNMEEAKAYSQNKSRVPYYLIGGAGIILLLLLIWRLIKVLKK